MAAEGIAPSYESVRRNPQHAAMHDEGLRTIYERVLLPGDTVVDGGAHAGKHTVPMARAVGESGQVIAFEPLEEGRRRLVTAIADAGVGNVVLHDMALSDRAGQDLIFYYFPERPGISGLERREGVPNLKAEERRVTTTTIDRWAAHLEVSVIKLDVEGAEMLALAGAEATVRASRPIVFVEAGLASWRPFGFAAADLSAWCDSHGYRCFDLVGNELPSAEAVDASFRTPGVWDYVLVPATDPRNRIVLPLLDQYLARFR